MNINLKKYAKYAQKERVVLNLKDRLPYFIDLPCEMVCVFQVIEYHDYALIMMEVDGLLHIECQRCLEAFEYTYHHTSEIAIFRTDEDAARHMASFDCMVSQTGEVDLIEIVTDELHLCGHEKHIDITQCQQVL